MPSEQDDRRRTVPRNVGARSVDDVRQVQSRQHLLNQLAAELALHERVGGDQTHETRRLPITSGQRQLKKAFGERHAQ